MAKLSNYIDSIVIKLTGHGDNKVEILTFFSKLTAFFTFLYAIVSGYIMHNMFSFIECALYGLFCLFLPVLLKKKINYRLLANLFVLGGALNVYYNAYQFGGINSSVMTWTVYIPIVPLLLSKERDAIKWLVAALIVNFIFWYYHSLQVLTDKDQRVSLFNLFVYQGLDVLIFLFSYFFYSSRNKVEKDLISKNKELELTKMELLESQNSKDIFIANISHEMRNPISIIKGLISIVIKSEQNETSRIYLQKCIENANQLTSIINDLLDISNLETGKISIIKSNFDLYKLINSSDTYFENKVGQKKLKYSIVIKEGTPQLILSDPTRIVQIINNLLDNAIKYTYSGSIELLCYYLNSKIYIQISDTGIGIPEDKYDLIFENFYRVNYDNSISGSGLGLSIVQKIVKLIGGEILVKSKVNNGSVFTFSFPYEYDAQLNISSVEQTLAKFHETYKGLCFLVADDMLLNHIIIENVLKESIPDCNVDFVTDGLEVLEIIKTKTYDIILMDINMPNKNGIETTKEIRELYGSKQHIIAFSANAQKKEIDYAKSLGFDEYVIKPMEVTDLLLKIDSVMQSASAHE